MTITPQQMVTAQANQNAAAHEQNTPVRLIAGPGTGKSFTIQERVNWLLQNGVPPETIFVISFTRASAFDLRQRIHGYCLQQGRPNPEAVSVTTLHSLALRALRTARLLTYYPSSPLILDDWEVKNIFDNEFSIVARSANNNQGYTPGRCEDIRKDYEAFCGTGIYSPASLIPPNPPISQPERTNYQTFHVSRTQIYSCVLPGELVKQCVEQMQSGIFDPVALLGMSYLIVDEYQDLNPVDLQFIDLLIGQNINTFVAGDDDQSIYSFRFASPQGIQLFNQRFVNAVTHEIVDCFRCTPEVLEAAHSLINANSEPNRLPKQTSSLYSNATPPEQGVVHHWSFRSGVAEARAIASSCNKLMQRGLPANEIMIILSNTRAQLDTILQELDSVAVQYESPRAEAFIDTRLGRFILGILRVTCNNEDYLAHRLILGQYPNVGAITCNQIAEIVSANNLNFKDLCYNPLPNGLFTARTLTALNNTRTICGITINWQASDTLQLRTNEINNMIMNSFGDPDLQIWEDQIVNLPQDITLEELRDYLWIDKPEQLSKLLDNIYTRLGIARPENAMNQPKVKVMTIHGAKGLSAKVVFIPGLEENMLPSVNRIPYNGLVLEAARMLYVSITRAKSACVVSHANYRVVNGTNTRQTPSRFLRNLNGQFVQRTDGLDDLEADQIIASCNNL